MEDEISRLPFYAPSSRLPAPLPSTNAIESRGAVIREETGRRVVRFGQHYLIKYGLNVSLMECENLLFVLRHRIVPVPEVFAVFSELDARGASVNYIIMQFIPGKCLQALWPCLSTDEKELMVDKLRRHVDNLREFPSSGYFGCLGRRPFEDPMLWVGPAYASDGSLSGPFDTEQSLNDAMVYKYILISGIQHKGAYYSRALPIVLRGHRPVFTHGDLQKKNLIVAEDGKLFFIDWETAGWYPEYWEYALAMAACGGWRDDWHQYVAIALEEYHNEFMWVDTMRKEIWS